MPSSALKGKQSLYAKLLTKLDIVLFRLESLYRMHKILKIYIYIYTVGNKQNIALFKTLFSPAEASKYPTKSHLSHCNLQNANFLV